MYIPEIIEYRCNDTEIEVRFTIENVLMATVRSV